MDWIRISDKVYYALPWISYNLNSFCIRVNTISKVKLPYMKTRRVPQFQTSYKHLFNTDIFQSHAEILHCMNQSLLEEIAWTRYTNCLPISLGSQWSSPGWLFESLSPKRHPIEPIRRNWTWFFLIKYVEVQFTYIL